MKQINNQQINDSIISPLGFGWSTGFATSKKTLRKSIRENKNQQSHQSLKIN